MRAVTMPCREFVGAIRHHTYFLKDDAARARLTRFCDDIHAEGVRAFLDREYPVGSDKAIIINVIEGTPCVVDGNAHLVALVMCDQGVTLDSLAECAGRTDFVRFWDEGWESGSGQTSAFDTYIPFEVDVSYLPGAREGWDGFKQPPMRINIIPSNIAFDTSLLSDEDRGRTIEETVRALRPSPQPNLPLASAAGAIGSRLSSRGFLK